MPVAGYACLAGAELATMRSLLIVAVGLGAIWLGMLAMMKLPKRIIITLAIGAIAVAAIGWSFVLKDYQKDRILTFLDPARDPRGRGYNITQSIVAVGAGAELAVRHSPVRIDDHDRRLPGETVGAGHAVSLQKDGVAVALLAPVGERITGLRQVDGE